MYRKQCFWGPLLSLLLFAPVLLPAQQPQREICDNGIDDDQDGLIDLNDLDCYCPPKEPVSLIPNPSFEEQNCCPSDPSDLSCADDWIQASFPTTDLIAECGWPGWDRLRAPTPFPDGSAVMGFRNGVPSREELGIEGRPFWKEYAGACLRGPLVQGEAYRIEFEVGFTQENSPPTELYFFGTNDCQYLPFGGDNDAFGCPSRDPNWMRLGRVNISGTDEWKTYEITVTPTVDINAIAIGPDCSPNYGEVEAYYYFDDLILAEQSAFEFSIQPSGNPCSARYELLAPNNDSLTYQWYLDGVALSGETEASIFPQHNYGEYQVRLSGPNSCNLLPPFIYQETIQRESLPVTICARDEYFFVDRFLREPGTYYDTLISRSGCDSIVTLELQLRPLVEDTLLVRLLPGEIHQASGRYFSSEGSYNLALVDVNGCDSLVSLTIDQYEVYIPNAFSPNFDGVNDQFSVFIGDGVVAAVSLEIVDRWGSKVYAATQSGESQSSYEPMSWDPSLSQKQVPNGTYIYRIKLLFDDGKPRVFVGDVAVVR